MSSGCTTAGRWTWISCCECYATYRTASQRCISIPRRAAVLKLIAPRRPTGMNGNSKRWSVQRSARPSRRQASKESRLASCNVDAGSRAWSVEPSTRNTMTRYLVTGGAGFIGSHVVETLLNRGKRVRVLDNFFTGKRENLEAVRGDVELIEGDVRDGGLCREAIGGIDAVIHLAALHEVGRPVECPLETHEVNVTGTVNLLAESAPTIYGDGEQSRDFTFIADCVSAVMAACEIPGLSGMVLNVGTGHRTTVNELCALLQKILHTDLSPTYAPPQPGDLPHD